jgi:hypothetical protein
LRLFCKVLLPNHQPFFGYSIFFVSNSMKLDTFKA